MASTALRRSSHRSPRATARCPPSVRSLAQTTLRMSPTMSTTRQTSGREVSARARPLVEFLDTTCAEAAVRERQGVPQKSTVRWQGDLAILQKGFAYLHVREQVACHGGAFLPA